MSKAELERLARDLNVKGRSKMSRAELQKAVREVAPSDRSRRAS